MSRLPSIFLRALMLVGEALYLGAIGVTGQLGWVMWRELQKDWSGHQISCFFQGLFDIFIILLVLLQVGSMLVVIWKVWKKWRKEGESEGTRYPRAFAVILGLSFSACLAGTGPFLCILEKQPGPILLLAMPFVMLGTAKWLDVLP